MGENKAIIKSDGNRRRIKVSSATGMLALPGYVDISFCNNGSLQTIVSIDSEMLDWLQEAINEYKASANE